MKSYAVAAAIAFCIAVLFGVMSCLRSLEEDYEHQSDLQPAISFVNTFITKHGRCPDPNKFLDFDSSSDNSYTLRCDTRYVRSRGGGHTNDYVLGVWLGESFYCYRSWDEQYYYDERDEHSTHED